VETKSIKFSFFFFLNVQRKRFEEENRKMEQEKREIEAEKKKLIEGKREIEAEKKKLEERKKELEESIFLKINSKK